MTDQPFRRRIAHAIHRYDNHHALSGNDIPSKHHLGEADAVLAEMKPELDRLADYDARPAAVPVPPPADQTALLRAHVALAEQAGRDQAALARVRRLHDALDAETALTSPDDEITRSAAARKIAAALDGWTAPAPTVLAVLPEQADRGAEAERPLSPDYEHPECGFHWHGRDGMDIPMRDGQPVCPRCELAKVEKKLAYVQRMRDEVGAECKRRGRIKLEQAERIVRLERELDGVRDQLGKEMLRADDAEAELRRLAAEEQPAETQDALVQARATNQRLNLRAQALESELAAHRRAVRQWEVSERGTYIPHSSLRAIGKACGVDVLGTVRHLKHFERVEQAEAAIEGVRALHRKASHGRTCVYCAHGQRLGYDTDWPCDTIRALDDAARPAVGEQPETQEARHLGGRANAEDCPACKGTNPPYPFLCPGPDTP